MLMETVDLFDFDCTMSKKSLKPSSQPWKETLEVKVAQWLLT